MKTIGLIGGMSWESSLEYYRIINERIKEKLGGLHSAKCLMYSVDFYEVNEMQHKGRWDEAAEVMKDAAMRLERGGADIILICTNTMHKLYNEVQSCIKIPILHIADATAEVIKKRDLKNVGLLGTRFTMDQDFYKARLKEKHIIDVIVPDEDDRQIIHDVIFKELCLGKIEDASKARFIDIIAKLVGAGAQGIILGCTEIPHLIKQADVDIPLFDTAKIHAEAAVEEALKL
jgi:aspartate racemase